MIVFVGDSVTERWNMVPDLVDAADSLSAHLPDFVDAGISGNETGQMVARFDTDVLAFNPDTVVILGGINDIKSDGIDPSTIASNLFTMVQKAESTGARVIVGTVLAAGSNYFPIESQRIQVNAQVDALNKLIVTGARQYGYTVVDYHTPMLNADGTANQDVLADGLHPNSRGYAIMWGALKPLLPNSLNAR